jgi:hypothetical protein
LFQHSARVAGKLVDQGMLKISGGGRERRYLEEQLKDVFFAERFKKAGEAWASPKIIPITEG